MTKSRTPWENLASAWGFDLNDLSPTQLEALAIWHSRNPLFKARVYKYPSRASFCRATGLSKKVITRMENRPWRRTRLGNVRQVAKYITHSMGFLLDLQIVWERELQQVLDPEKCENYLEEHGRWLRLAPVDSYRRHRNRLGDHLRP